MKLELAALRLRSKRVATKAETPSAHNAANLSPLNSLLRQTKSPEQRYLCSIPTYIGVHVYLVLPAPPGSRWRFSFGAGRPIIRKKRGEKRREKREEKKGKRKKEEEKERKKYNGHVNPTPSQREGQ